MQITNIKRNKRPPRSWLSGAFDATWVLFIILGLSEVPEHPMDIFLGHVLCSLEQLASRNSFSFLVGSWGLCCALFFHGRENMAGVMDKLCCVFLPGLFPGIFVSTNGYQSCTGQRLVQGQVQTCLVTHVLGYVWHGPFVALCQLAVCWTELWSILGARYQIWQDLEKGLGVMSTGGGKQLP